VKKFAKRYYKCSLVGCSNCSSTDIRVNHVCNFFVKTEII
jgi:hypothetical protein